MEGFPWNNLRKIVRGGQRMAKVQNGVRNIAENFNRLYRAYERYGQADLRQQILERNVVAFG